MIQFRNARDTELDFHPHLTVLAGVNGAGKSTVLDAIAILLSWAVTRIRSTGSKGRPIREVDIHNSNNSSALLMLANGAPMGPFSWSLAQTRKGRNPDINTTLPTNKLTNLNWLNLWGMTIRTQIGKPTPTKSVPVFVYYPVIRAVLDIPLRIRKSHSFDLMEAYDEALTGAGNFRLFFEWFRNREDLENEQRADPGTFRPDPQLEAVRQALLTFLPHFTRISVKRNPLRMEVSKGDERLRVDQLSDGEKCLFAMVGDLARRLAIANPGVREPLHGDGIVLIDEIDLHLHPAWQRMVARKLVETFPNCQFIVSTHSPQVLGEIDAPRIRLLTVDPVHGLVCSVPEQSIGLDTSAILEVLMDSRSQNEDITKRLDKVFELIDRGKHELARKKMQEVRDLARGELPELVRAEALLTMLDCEETPAK
ncbi:MAG: AAA family ATPase [Candidatus Competibacteraceae bacterium]|nr:AAA family ATPase [Candidatus Competibacteraceae bacterium]